ncbi:MAG: heme ABC transporter ATP-binding protein [bacterium]|nr:heme ABC transporter ATP-binding protein [bacterium]
MLKVENISASYRERQVLEGISFQVGEGEFLGIIGPNGAGKTTLLKVMTGVKQPLAGKVMLDGKNLDSLSRKQIARIMAVVPQSSFIPPLFTVEDVVLMGRYPHQKSRFTTTEEDCQAVEEAMRKTNTTGFRHRLVSELSGGERQEVIIARALAQEPKILMLDEPTANLDIKHQMKILGLARTLVREGSITAIMVIHDLNLAARFCDQLILLHDQKIQAEGSPQEVLTPTNLAKSYEVEVEVDYKPSIDSLQVVVIA